MLARMLLHVITSSLHVDHTVNAAALLDRPWTFEKVEDLSVISFRHVGYANSAFRVCRRGGKDPSRIKDLPAAGGIEGGPIQNDSGTRIGIRRRKIQHFRVEFVKKRIVVIEAFGHIRIARGRRMLSAEC